MTAERAKPRGERPPKKIGLLEQSSILAYGDLRTDLDAAKRFKVSPRTIARWRRELRRGQLPELAELVTQAKLKAAEKHGDLLDSGFEAAVTRIKRLLPKATIEEAIKAAETLGDLKITRDMFGGGHASPATAGKDQAVRASAGRDGRAEAGGSAGRPESDTPVH